MNKPKLKKTIRDLVTHMCSDMFGGGVYYYQGEYEQEIDKIIEAIREEKESLKGD